MPASTSVPASASSHALSGFGYISAAAGVRSVLQIAAMAAVARVVSVEDFGLFGAALIVVGLSTLSSQLGLGPAIIQKKEVTREQRDAALTISVVLGLLAGAAVFALAPVLEQLFAAPGLAPVLRVLAVVFPVTGISVLAEALLHREMRFRRFALVEIGSFLGAYAAPLLIAAWAGAGLWALVLSLLVHSIVRTIAMVLAAGERMRLTWHLAPAVALLRFGSGFTLSQLANYFALNADNFIVGRLLGVSALGVYGRAYQLMSAPANLLGESLEKVLFPAVSRLQGAEASVRETFCRSTRLLALVILPATLAFTLATPDIVAILLGERWRAVTAPLQILACGLYFRTAPKLSISFVKAAGCVSKLAMIQLGYALSVAALSIVGCRWGVEGVALGVTLAIFLYFSAMTWTALRVSRVGFVAYLGLHVPGVLAAASLWLLCTGLCQLTGFGAFAPLVRLSVIGTLFAALGCGILFRILSNPAPSSLVLTTASLARS